MKKLFALIMSVLMIACFMPTMAFAADETAPTVSGDEITVTPENAQATLDGKYGPINGKTIVLTKGTYDMLTIGGVTADTKGDITLTCNHTDGTHYSYANAEEYKTHINENVFHYTSTYTRTMENVTFVASDNVTVNGILIESGHLHQHANPFREGYTGYYMNHKLTNFTFKGINFAGNVNINTSSADTVIDGFTFDGCTFTTDGTDSDKGQAIRYYNENNNGQVKNLVVKDCKFNDCYQGVYTMKVRGISVTGCVFDTTGHNAIAVQGVNVNHGAVVIADNTFAKIGDRIIRFNTVGADTQITISNNTATNSGDKDGEVIKATSLADGITYNVCKNNWGEGKKVANNEFSEQTAVAQIGNIYYPSLQAAVDAAADKATIKLLQDVKLSGKLVVDKTITLDGDGKTITANGINNDHLLLLTASATVKNVVLDSAGIAKGVNTYGQAKDLTFDFENVKMLNSAGTGVTAKGGTLTLKDVKISGSAWTQSIDISSSKEPLNNGANLVIEGETTLEDQLQVVFDEPSEGRVGTITANGWNVTSEDKTFGEGEKAYTKRVFSLAKKSSGSSSRLTPLDKAKTEANTAISAAASANKYDEAEQAEVKKILDQAAADIKNAKTEEEVKVIQEAAQAEIEKVLTTEEKEQIAAVGSVDKEIFKAKSKYSKLNGKRAIKVTWNVPNGMKLDGYEVFRSTKKYSGFGKTPYFTTSNTSYTNNKELVAGKTYYYKVRGFVEINGERYYTGFSTKAYRTIK